MCEIYAVRSSQILLGFVTFLINLGVLGGILFLYGDLLTDITLDDWSIPFIKAKQLKCN